MKFPKPIGYYSISLPDEIVTEIESLNRDQLRLMIYDASEVIAEVSFGFMSHCLSSESDKIIETSFTNLNDWLQFITWLLDGLKQLHN